MSNLQDHDSTKEGSEDRANQSYRLEVSTNEGADTVPGAGAAAAAALGRGARGGGVWAGLHASAVGGGEARRVAVGASELHKGQASHLGAGVVVDSGGHVGGSLMNAVSFKFNRGLSLLEAGSTHHAGNGSARGGGDSRSHEVITTAGALGQVPVGQECGLSDERRGTSCRLLLLCGLVDRGQSTHINLEVLLLQELVCFMLEKCPVRS